MFGLFRTRTFTDNWQRRNPLGLTVELKDNSLCGVRLGDSIKKFSFLGQAEKLKAVSKEKSLYYLSMGMCLSFDEDDEKFCELRVIWSDYLKEGFAPYSGKLMFSGNPVASPEMMDKKSVLSVLGEPYWTDRDQEEEIVFYDTPKYEWQFEFDLEGRLKQLIVTDSPLLSDDIQRKAYGVVKPWPPIAIL